MLTSGGARNPYLIRDAHLGGACTVRRKLLEQLPTKFPTLLVPWLQNPVEYYGYQYSFTNQDNIYKLTSSITNFYHETPNHQYLIITTNLNI